PEGDDEEEDDPTDTRHARACPECLPPVARSTARCLRPPAFLPPADAEGDLPMIFHASIPAQEPEKVAAVLAELLQGKVTPFGARKGAFMAHSGHHRGHMIEVLPAAPEALATIAEPRRLYDAVHLALASELSADQVLAIGEREGWR